jgi:hypothetical protein
MRLGFILMVLLVTALVIGGMTFLHRHAGNPLPAPTVAAPSAPTAVVQLPPAMATSWSPPVPVSAPAPGPVAAQPVTPEKREAAIESEKDRLAALEMNDDAGSLSNILADLNSPEKEIRMAAIEAAVQFRSTNAIPVLQNAAANDQDVEEKIALLKAVDFLASPEVTFGSGQ